MAKAKFDEVPIIDISDGSCKTCHKRDQDGDVCADCNKPGAPYESQTWDHVHLTLIEGKQTKAPAKRRLCKDCYPKDFKARYPDATPPKLA
jgi:hypothetical protein